jgi:DNA-binding response OmpR family regulator
VYDELSTRHAVITTMERGGFTVVVLPGPVSGLLSQAGDHAPALFVLDLASSGFGGLRLVGALRARLPDCAIVLLSPFESLRERALEAGAYDLVGRDDLRTLAACLRRLNAELDARAGSRAEDVPDPAHGVEQPRAVRLELLSE